MAHKRTKRKMTDKQALITVLSIVGAAVLLIVALILISTLSGEDPTDPHAGHDHSTGTTLADGAKVTYQLYTEADGTYRLVFRDNAGQSVAEYKGIQKQPIQETVDEENGVYELGWATDNGPSDYECVYYNVKTGQVSAKFIAPRGTDGVRIAYGSDDQKKVIVADLFDDDGYYKEYTLENATANKDGDVIMGGSLQADNKTVVISYLSDDDGTNSHVSIKLYE